MPRFEQAVDLGSERRNQTAPPRIGQQAEGSNHSNPAPRGFSPAHTIIHQEHTAGVLIRQGNRLRFAWIEFRPQRLCVRTMNRQDVQPVGVGEFPRIKSLRLVHDDLLPHGIRNHDSLSQLWQQPNPPNLGKDDEGAAVGDE